MDVNEIQKLVLVVIAKWVQTEKVPITQRLIVETISQERAIPCSTVKAAVRRLVVKGYLRKAISINNRASYVQLRSL